MFPLTVIDDRTGEDTGEVVYPELAYPYRSQIISSGLDTALAILVPLFFLLIIQIRIRNFWDLNNTVIGYIYSIETSAAFQVMIKWLIGGLRPNFYDICKPDPSLASDPTFNVTGWNGVGYRQYMYTSDICTSGQTRALWNAMQSFPSGHSTTIWAAYVYLYLYLNAKLKVFANYHPSMWKLILLYCPILGAVLVCGSLNIDQSHNWYDIVAGAIISTVFAFSSYRMVYASIWDWRVNHIPLNRASAFIWSEGYEASDLVFTNRAGWRATQPAEEKEALPTTVPENDGNMASVANAQSDGTMNNYPAEYSVTNGYSLGQAQCSLLRSRYRGEDMV